MRRLPSSHHLKIKFCGNLVRYSFWCTLESRACNSQRGMGNKTGVAANNAMAIKQRPTPPSARPSQPSLDGVSSSLKDIKMMATKYHIEKAIKVHICRVQGPTQAQSRAVSKPSGQTFRGHARSIAAWESYCVDVGIGRSVCVATVCPFSVYGAR